MQRLPDVWGPALHLEAGPGSSHTDDVRWGRMTDRLRIRPCIADRHEWWRDGGSQMSCSSSAKEGCAAVRTRASRGYVMAAPEGFRDKVTFVWKVADKLRGHFTPHEYGSVMLRGCTRNARQHHGEGPPGSGDVPSSRPPRRERGDRTSTEPERSRGRRMHRHQ